MAKPRQPVYEWRYGSSAVVELRGTARKVLQFETEGEARLFMARQTLRQKGWSTDDGSLVGVSARRMVATAGITRMEFHLVGDPDLERRYRVQLVGNLDLVAEAANVVAGFFNGFSPTG